MDNIKVNNIILTISIFVSLICIPSLTLAVDSYFVKINFIEKKTSSEDSRNSSWELNSAKPFEVLFGDYSKQTAVAYSDSKKSSKDFIVETFDNTSTNKRLIGKYLIDSAKVVFTDNINSSGKLNGDMKTLSSSAQSIILPWQKNNPFRAVRINPTNSPSSSQTLMNIDAESINNGFNFINTNQCVKEKNKGSYKVDDKCCSGLISIPIDVDGSVPYWERYPISFYCARCGDNKCDTPYENYNYCPLDCEKIKSLTKTFTIGLFDPKTNQFVLRNTNNSGNADLAFGFGVANSGQIPLTGDWDGNGTTTIGLFDPKTNQFVLRNTNNSGNADLAFGFGVANSGQMPLTGDWDGNGTTTIGLFDPKTNQFVLRNSNNSGNADMAFGFGVANSGQRPIVGDWDGDGKTTVGLFDPKTNQFVLRNTNNSGNADLSFGFGVANSGQTPITGDWDGDGKTTIGLFDPRTNLFLLRNTNSTGMADIAFGFGAANSGQIPIIGAWLGAKVAVIEEVNKDLSVGALIRSATASLFDSIWNLFAQIPNIFKK